MSVLTVAPVLDLGPFHPNVQLYRDGGLGGLGDDHRVVGLVPTSALVPYRSHDGYWNTTPDAHNIGVIAALRADLRSGAGFHTPLMLEYDHVTGWAYLGEGNHRLAAAVAEQVPVVPVRVLRSPSARHGRSTGVGAPAAHHPIPGCGDGYVPSDIHPDYLRLLAA